MNDKIIIHINGPSGAGKSTINKELTKQYANKIEVIETDDIDDKVVLELLKKNTNINKIEKQRDKQCKEQLEHIINNSNKKIIIITGMTIMPKLVTYGFTIKINPKLLYKQHQLRNLEIISKNKNKIKNILENDEFNPDYKYNLIKFTFGIRGSFGMKYTDFISRVDRAKKESIENKYKYLDKNKIIDHVAKIIEKYQ